MGLRDFKDINIRYEGHPKFLPNKMIENSFIEVIIQKLEMILFTKQGDVLSSPNMGCNIEYYLWETKVPSKRLKKIILDQISKFVPELNAMEYTLSVDLYQGTVRDIMYINIAIKQYSVNFIFE